MKQLSLFVIFIFCVYSQYPTSNKEWDFMIETGQDFVDIRGGLPLLKGGNLPALNAPVGWREPVITALGWSYEGEEVACYTTGANGNMGETFATHFWIYIYDLTSEQAIYCREWLEDETDIELNSIRYCLMINEGQLVFLWNPSDALTHRRNWKALDHFNYMYQKMDLYVKYGWTYIAFNVETDALQTKSQIWGFMATADQ